MSSTNISNAIIEEIRRDGDTVFVTVRFGQNPENMGNENMIRMVLDERTIILNRAGQEVMPDDLREGMLIDAKVSSSMTRSIPPQAVAFLIRILREARPENPRPQPPGPGNPPRPGNPPGPGNPPRPGNPPGPGSPPMEPPAQEDVRTGRIWNVDRNNRSFDVITGQNISSLTRFNVPEDAIILNRMGMPMNFNGLMIGMRVRVRHANFMTASIPPQTTAFEVRVL